MRSFRPQARRGFRPGQPASRPYHERMLSKKLGINFKTLSQIKKFIEEAKTAPTEQVVEQVEHSFADFLVPNSVREAIIRCGYTIPTPIQDKVIPLALIGRDIIGIANTGTGKTAAFLIPLITRMLSNKLKKVLILAPTRELATQIQDDFYTLSKDSGLRSVLCIGGTSVRQQMKTLKSNYQFLIGTPGRIKDMMQQQMIPMSQFDGLILDEVDRMFDMGFIRDVREIVGKLPTTRQSMFFSATLPREVETLCMNYSKNPQRLSTRTTEYAAMVEQHIVELGNGRRKLDVLYDLLSNQNEFKKVIIFGRTKHGVKRLAKELDARGFAVDSIHGNKTQAARQKSLDMFKATRISILVATDVAARGIDVTDISHVINYDLPETVDDYIHRIGRTGRAGKTGVALTLVD